MMNEVKRKETLHAYYEVFASPYGKLVLDDLAKMCYRDQSLFNGDPMVMAFREGMRNVYLGILAIVEEAKGNKELRQETAITQEE